MRCRLAAVVVGLVLCGTAAHAQDDARLLPSAGRASCLWRQLPDAKRTELVTLYRVNPFAAALGERAPFSDSELEAAANACSAAGFSADQVTEGPLVYAAETQTLAWLANAMAINPNEIDSAFLGMDAEALAAARKFIEDGQGSPADLLTALRSAARRLGLPQPPDDVLEQLNAWAALDEATPANEAQRAGALVLYLTSRMAREAFDRLPTPEEEAPEVPLQPLTLTFNYADPVLPAHQPKDSSARPLHLQRPFVDTGEQPYDPETLAGGYPGRPQLRFVDCRLYPITPEAHFILISTEGYGGEGHVVVVLFRMEDEGAVVDGAFGLYNRNGAEDFAPSFTIDRPHDPASPSHDRCGSPTCPIQVRPNQEALEHYRSGWQGLFGAVPHDVVRQIMRTPSRAAVIRLDAIMYAVRLRDMKQRGATVVALTPQYAGESFVGDWTDLLDTTCLSLPAFVCESAGDNSLVWPNRRFSDLTFDFWAGTEFHDIGELAAFIPRQNRQPVRIAAEDTIAPTGAANTESFVCFETPMNLGGRGTPRITAYKGGIRDGLAEGPGEVFFEDCDDARTDPVHVGRLQAQFERGYARGPASYYDPWGKLTMAGNVDAAYLDGPVRLFSEGGVELASASFQDGAPNDTAVWFAEHDYHFSDALAPSIRRVFDGTIHGSEATGTWTDLPLFAEYTDGYRQGLLGDTLFIEGPDGIWGTGKARKRQAGERYYLSGQGELGYSNGDRIRGTWRKDGRIIVGPVRYWSSKYKKWYSMTLDQNGQGRITVRTRRRGSWLENVGRELKRWADDAVGVVDSAGHGFERFMCRLTGTKEGENCSVSAGVAVGTDGPVLTDGEGVASDLPPGADTEIDWDAALQWQTTTELQDFEYDFLNQFPVLESLVLFRTPAGTSVTPLRLEIGAPTASGEIRGCDGGGCGHFGARRRDQRTNSAGETTVRYRMHNGTDYLTSPGELIFSPATGTVTAVRDGFVQIRTPSGNRIEITYVLPLKGPGAIAPGSSLSRGSIVGHAENLSARYPGARNHVHVQLWTPSANPARGFWTSPDGLTRAAGRGDVP